MRRCLLCVTSLALVLLAAAPAAADWLVTREGRRIETSGPWEQRGRLVVFRTAEGTLSSLRADSLDLEASVQLSGSHPAEAKAPDPAPPPPPRAAVLVLTDDDVAHVDEDGEPEAGPGAATPAPGELTVPTWERDEDYDGLGVRLTGLLENGTPNQAADVELSVMLYDAEGKLLDAQNAELTATILGPGDRSRFLVVFEDVPAYTSVRFAPSSGRRYLRDATPSEPLPADEDSFSSER